MYLVKALLRLLMFLINSENSMRVLGVVFVLLTSILCGCAYHQPIQQGNIITLSKAQLIHPGMSSVQVVSQLGSPVLHNVFSDNRMNYVYTSQPTRNKTVIRKLVVEFRSDRVVNVRTDLR